MYKVDTQDLNEITKFLDKVSTLDGTWFTSIGELEHFAKKSKILSKMIKDKYTEIKPDYDRTD
jgi:hypothetical protein